MAEPRVEERLILSDCCEDWILEWGPYYEAGQGFACPECATSWRKESQGRFVRETDERAFRRRERRAGDATFAYLGAEEGREPIVERCCARILLAHGQHMQSGGFECPVCRTRWTISSTRSHGMRVATFSKPGLEEPLTIQPGRTRPFLVVLSRYSPPRE